METIGPLGWLLLGLFASPVVAILCKDRVCKGSSGCPWGKLRDLLAEDEYHTT